MANPDQDQVSVNFPAMVRAAEEYAAAVKQLEGILHQLNIDLRNNIGDWIGDAHNGYNVVQTKWTNSAHHMAGAVQQLGIAIHASHDIHLDAEMKSAQLWAG